MRWMLPRSIVIAIALLVVPIVCGAESPKEPFTSFAVATDNIPQARIAAWYLPARGPAKGTVFMAHGFRNSKQLLVPYQWIRDEQGFPVSDEQAILDASPSPDSLKRLEIIPGAGHAQQWKWPPNDQFIRDFLAESTRRTAGSALDETSSGALVSFVIVIAAGLGWRAWRRGVANAT